MYQYNQWKKIDGGVPALWSPGRRLRSNRQRQRPHVVVRALSLAAASKAAPARLQGRACNVKIVYRLFWYTSLKHVDKVAVDALKLSSVAPFFSQRGHTKQFLKSDYNLVLILQGLNSKKVRQLLFSVVFSTEVTDDSSWGSTITLCPFSIKMYQK